MTPPGLGRGAAGSLGPLCTLPPQGRVEWKREQERQETREQEKWGEGRKGKETGWTEVDCALEEGGDRMGEELCASKLNL